jgi:hypothetical protein
MCIARCLALNVAMHRHDFNLLYAMMSGPMRCLMLARDKDTLSQQYFAHAHD